MNGKNHIILRVINKINVVPDKINRNCVCKSLAYFTEPHVNIRKYI